MSRVEAKEVYATRRGGRNTDARYLESNAEMMTFYSIRILSW